MAASFSPAALRLRSRKLSIVLFGCGVPLPAEHCERYGIVRTRLPGSQRLVRGSCASSGGPQDLVQVRVIEDVPEPSYDLPISLRLIRNHLLDLPQRECEKRVAAALQCRLYGGRTDELAYSRNRRGVRKVVGRRQISPQESF
jgi:hypothetical protein